MDPLWLFWGIWKKKKWKIFLLVGGDLEKVHLLRTLICYWGALEALGNLSVLDFIDSLWGDLIPIIWPCFFFQCPLCPSHLLGLLSTLLSSIWVISLKKILLPWNGSTLENLVIFILNNLIYNIHSISLSSGEWFCVTWKLLKKSGKLYSHTI